MDLKKKIMDMTDDRGYFYLEEEDIKIVDQYEKGEIPFLFYSFDTVYGPFLKPNAEELTLDLPDADTEDYLVGAFLIPTQKWKIKGQPKVGIHVDEKYRYILDAHPTCNQMSEKKYKHKFYLYILFDKPEGMDFDDWHDNENDNIYHFTFARKNIAAIRSLMDEAKVSNDLQKEILKGIEVD